MKAVSDEFALQADIPLENQTEIHNAAMLRFALLNSQMAMMPKIKVSLMQRNNINSKRETEPLLVEIKEEIGLPLK